MAVESAEPYASYLHFAPEDNHASQIFTVRMPFLTPNQQHQSTEGQKNLNLTSSKFKKSSHLCAYHCAQLSYTTQPGAVMIIFLLTSRQASQLRYCLLAGAQSSDKKFSLNYVLLKSLYNRSVLTDLSKYIGLRF